MTTKGSTLTTPDSSKLARLVQEYHLRAPQDRAAFVDEVCGNDAAMREELYRAIADSSVPESGRPAVDPDATLDLPQAADVDATIDLPVSGGTGGVDPDATLDQPDPVDADATVDLDGDSEGAAPQSRSQAQAAKAQVNALPEQIGDFRIIGLLGEGGMGAVYLADQLHPRRRVALKVIKAKIISEDAIKRFEVEGETLAKLSHPGVAQVFAAGIESDAGGSVPFFAMEYVDDAKTITDWAEDHSLDLRSRLELFADACDALSHAHQRGVIHRDLKPGNVLVNGLGELKVIDFGVAQVEEDQQAELDQPRQIVGTLQYMPPEQVRGDQDIDTSCDVYAFGVVLYQMLVGQLPYEIDTTSIANAITSVIEAPTPSLLEVKPGLGRDLDAVIAKSLAKERGDRYSSAAELGADIRRYLADEPITARSQTTGEAIRRFMRKHRTATSAIVIICLVIIAGLISVSVFAYRAEVARAEENRQRLVAEEATRRVERERERLEEIVEFQADMIKNVNPSQMGRTLRMSILESTRNKAENSNYEVEDIEFILADQEDFLASFNPTDVAKELFDIHILRSGLGQIPRRFEGDPQTEAAVREIIGDSYETLGLYELAEPEYVRALEIRTELLGPNAPETLESTDDLGILRMNQGRLDESRQLYASALKGRREVLGTQHPDTIASLQNLGNSMLLQGDLEGAKLTLQEAYASSLRVNGELYPNTITILGNLGYVHSKLGELETAKEQLTQALALTQRLYGDDTSEAMEVLRNIAAVLMQTGDLASASDYLESALAAYKKYLGERHPDTLRVMYELGAAHLNLQEYEEADPLLNAAYNGQRDIRGDGHPETFETLFQLSLLYLSQDQFERSHSYWVLAHRSALKLFGVDHPLTFTTLYARADIATKGDLFSLSEGAIQELEELCLDQELVHSAARCAAVPALYQALYSRWDEVEPGRGYDSKAAKWNSILQSGANPTN